MLKLHNKTNYRLLCSTIGCLLFVSLYNLSLVEAVDDVTLFLTHFNSYLKKSGRYTWKHYKEQSRVPFLMTRAWVRPGVVITTNGMIPEGQRSIPMVACVQGL